ncbi:hypothetical protein OG233_02480 [Streptomyces sp. NBC_01218]|uniref:hypothetical protein n=1 Tax=unclassified Streptomyces TaxID=2593676 RepID=UPI002E1202D9|nr:hypothetical protein OG233_02480 [Streptomyces sp. NBC_01218]
MAHHVHEDELTELALGHRSATDGAAARHLRRCPECSAELDSLRAVVSAARAVTPADLPLPPPQWVWEAITAEIGG